MELMLVVSLAFFFGYLSAIEISRFWLDSGQDCISPHSEFLLHIVTNAAGSNLTGFLVRNGDDCSSKPVSGTFNCSSDAVDEVVLGFNDYKYHCFLRAAGDFVGSVSVCLCESEVCERSDDMYFFVSPSVPEFAVSSETGDRGERLTFRHNLATLGSVGEFLVVGDSQGTVTIVDPVSGSEKATLRHVEEDLLIRSIASTGGHDGLLSTAVIVVASNGEGFLISAGEDYRVVVWTPIPGDLGNFQAVCSVRMQYSVKRIVFEDRKVLIGTSSGKVIVFDLFEDSGVWELLEAGTFFVGCWITGIKFVEFPAKFAVSCADGQLLMWKLDDNVVPGFASRQDSGFMALDTFSDPDGTGYLITADASGTVKLWDALTGSEKVGWKLREGSHVGVGQSLVVWRNFLVARTKDAVHVFEVASHDVEGFWETLTLDDLTESTGPRSAIDGIQYSWRPVKQGRSDNRLYVNRTRSAIEFYPCNVAGVEDCASGLIASESTADAPIVEANFLLPFEYSKIKGKLTYEAVHKDGVVEDCRPDQRPISRWNKNFKNMWSIVATNKYPISGCQVLDFSSYDAQKRVTDCQAECASRRECNAVHVVIEADGISVSACEYRRCVDFLSIRYSAVALASGSVHQFWGYTNVDMSQGVSGSTGGFVALGTADEVVYGGCGAKNTVGVVEISEVSVDASNSLKIQVSQVRRDAAVRITAVEFEVFRSVLSARRIFKESSDARGVDPIRDAGSIASPTEYTGANLAVIGGSVFASVGGSRVGAWDIRSLAMGVEIQLATSAILEGEQVDEEYEYKADLGGFFDLVIRGPAGSLANIPEIVLTREAFCGAPNSHIMDKMVRLGERVLEGDGDLLRFRDSSITDPGEYLVCMCSSSCCNTAFRFSGNYAGTVVVAGPIASENAFICVWGQICELRNFAGVGLALNDRILLARKPADPSEVDVCGVLTREEEFPTDGFLISRTDGTYFRTEESPTEAVEVGVSMIGKVYLLCWCRGGSGRCNNNEENYTILGGTLTLVRFDVNVFSPFKCQNSFQCVIPFRPLTGPLDVGDQLMVKRASCADPAPVETFGNRGRSDLYSGNNQFSFGVLSEAVAANIYRLCWCQGSARSCKAAQDFAVDVGQTLKVTQPEFMFPDKCSVDFTNWRTPWASQDDCCCNFKEAGANPGCEEPGYVRDACQDDRYVINL